MTNTNRDGFVPLPPPLDHADNGPGSGILTLPGLTGSPTAGPMALPLLTKTRQAFNNVMLMLLSFGATAGSLAAIGLGVYLLAQKAALVP